MKFSMLFAALATSAFLLPAAASAQQQTVGTDLGVTAKIAGQCTIATTAVKFGPINTFTGKSVPAEGSLLVTCTSGVSYSAAANVGTGAGARYDSRRMSAVTAQSGDVVFYNLYTDPTHTTVWGDGTGTTAVLSGTGTGSGQTIPVYGRTLGATQFESPGTYADRVTVTLSY